MATVSSERSELHKHLRQTRRLRQRAAKRYREQWNADHLKPEANMDHVTVIDFNYAQVKSLELTPTAARLEETRIDDDGYEQHQDTCAELRCMEVLFESRLQLSRVANKRLQELITTWRAGTVGAPCDTYGCHPVQSELGRLAQVMDDRLNELITSSDELECQLSGLTWDEPVQDVYIGSSDDDDTGDMHNEQHVEFEYDDLVRLEVDVETFSGQTFNSGSVGRVCAVHSCDELCWVEVKFTDELRSHGVSASNLRLLERTLPPAGLEIVLDQTT